MSAVFPAGTYRPTSVNRVAWGIGSLESQIPALIGSANDFPPGPILLLVTSSLRNNENVLNRVTASLGDRVGGIFSDIKQHTPVASIYAALEAVEHAGATSIVSVGGGSIIDAAKAISFYHNKKHGKFLPQIAIPTTLSAAEMTITAGYTSEEGKKTGVGALELAPKFVVYDPELSLATPEKLWLSTGMRAVDHAVEALYRPASNPISRTLAVSALKDLFVFLPLSKKNPQDLEARSSLQVAAWKSIGNEVVPTALGLSHALGHRVGASYGIPHGITSCITLAPTISLLSHTEGTLSSRDVYDIQQAVASLPPSFLPAWKEGEHPGDVLSQAVKQLVAELGLTTSLSEWNVPEGDVQDIAEKGLGGLVGWDAARKPKVEDVVKMITDECM